MNDEASRIYGIRSVARQIQSSIKKSLPRHKLLVQMQIPTLLCFSCHGLFMFSKNASGSYLMIFKSALALILGDPGADSGGEGKSKQAEKYGTKKSKERPEEPLLTMSYQTSSKRSPPFWLLIGAGKKQVFWHQSEARTGGDCLELVW